MVAEALEARSNSNSINHPEASSSAAAPSQELGMTVDDANDASAPAILEETNPVQLLRAEANLLGEKLGLGNVLINEVREVYGLYVRPENGGLMAVKDLNDALGKLGFDGLPQEDVKGLLERHHHGAQVGAGISLEEFLYMFVELDQADTFITIV